MPDDVAFFHGGHQPVVEMKIAAANRGGGDAYDGVPGILNGGIGICAMACAPAVSAATKV